MSELLLPCVLLGGWTIFSSAYLRKAYYSPASINPYILENIPSVFPTLGIMCTAIGIAYGLSDFNTNDIQSSLPQLLGGLKSAFYATIAGILGLIVFQKILAFVQNHIDQSPARPRQSSDELTALDAIAARLGTLEDTLKAELQSVVDYLIESNKVHDGRLEEFRRLMTLQSDRAKENQQTNTEFSERILGSSGKLLEALTTHSNQQNHGIASIIKKMGASNELLTTKFDEFSELMNKNNTEALVEVMRASTEQFNAQMSELIDKLVKENFKELNNSVLMLNTWQQENKEQIAQLTGQVRTVVEQVDNATTDLKIASETLKVVAELSEELMDEDGKLMQLIKELDKVMISDSKFTGIVDKVEGAIDTLTETTDAFEETTQKLNVWVRNQMNFSDKAEVLIKQLEEFRNLNGSVWDKYRSEMEKSVKIVANASTTLSKDLENINQEFYERLNDTLENLDGLIQRFMSGQTTNRRI